MHSEVVRIRTLLPTAFALIWFYNTVGDGVACQVGHRGKLLTTRITGVTLCNGLLWRFLRFRVSVTFVYVFLQLHPR